MSSKRVLRIIAVCTIFLGTIFLLNSFQGLTGFAILEQIKETPSSILGTIFIVAGLILLSAAKREEQKENLESFVKSHAKSFKEFLEEGDFAFVPQKDRPEYQLYRKEILSLPHTKKYEYAAERLKHMFQVEEYQQARKEILNEAQEYLKRGYIPTKTTELIALARRGGYDISDHRKEGTLVKDSNGNSITVISNHREIKKGTARGILKALANSQSNFRQNARKIG